MPEESQNPQVRPGTAALPPKNEETNPEKTLSPVKDGDLRLTIYIGLTAVAILVIFGIWLYYSGLLSFPTMHQNGSEGYEAYYRKALDYRERRIALALVLRTFTVGLSFVVGLALCTQGGIFILRQVRAFTAVSATRAAQESAGIATRSRTPIFSFASYSPGVVFLVGGVALMMATQKFAITISSPEIVPLSAFQLCINKDQSGWIDCRLVEKKEENMAISNLPGKPASSDLCTTDPDFIGCPKKEGETK